MINSTIYGGQITPRNAQVVKLTFKKAKAVITCDARSVMQNSAGFVLKIGKIITKLMCGQLTVMFTSKQSQSMK